MMCYHGLFQFVTKTTLINDKWKAQEEINSQKATIIVNMTAPTTVIANDRRLGGERGLRRRSRSREQGCRRQGGFRARWGLLAPYHATFIGGGSVES